MNNKIVFSSVKTTKKFDNKKLDMDGDGYYTIILGALNIFNSGGAFYEEAGSKALFESSSDLMRRIKNGFLKAEVGHPKKQPGQTMSEYMNRILTIDPNNVCANIKEVWLEDSGKKDAGSDKNIIYIYGKVKPSGTKGDFLKELFDDPEANVAFSVRSLTKDQMVNGIVVKTLKTIIGWDFVIEPGLNVATKWKTLGIESLDLITISEDDTDTIDTLMTGLKEAEGVSTEDSLEIIRSVESVFDCKKNNSCIVHNW